MKSMAFNNTIVRRIAEYAVATFASIACICVLWELWKTDLRFPLVSMSGDAITAQAGLFKGLVDNAWCLDNRWLGAPFGANFRDFPLPDLLIPGAVSYTHLRAHETDS